MRGVRWLDVPDPIEPSPTEHALVRQTEPRERTRRLARALRRGSQWHVKVALGLLFLGVVIEDLAPADLFGVLWEGTLAVLYLGSGLTSRWRLRSRQGAARALLEDPARITHVAITERGAMAYLGTKSAELLVSKSDAADLHAALRAQCPDALFAPDAPPPALPPARTERVKPKK